METILNKLAMANTIGELEIATAACINYFAVASENEKQIIKTAMRTKTNEVIAQASKKQVKVNRFLIDLERKHLAASA